MLAVLSAGKTLVVDRYAYSGAAFTAAKGIVGLDLAWCKVSLELLRRCSIYLYRRLPACNSPSAESTISFMRYVRSLIMRSKDKRVRKASMCLQPKMYWPLQAPDSGLPAPDATIYLSMTAEAAAKRGGYGSERYEKVHPLQVCPCCPLIPDPMLVMPAKAPPCTQMKSEIYLAALHDVLPMVPDMLWSEG